MWRDGAGLLQPEVSLLAGRFWTRAPGEQGAALRDEEPLFHPFTPWTLIFALVPNCDYCHPGGKLPRRRRNDLVLTCSRFPERDSTSRIFLSRQVVAKRLPSVLKDMERTTSVWWLIVRTGFFITGSRQSRLQIITCVSGHTHTHLVPKHLGIHFLHAENNDNK